MKPEQRILQSKFIERLKRKLGKATGFHLKLKRFTASASEPLRTAMLLEHMGIQLVLDVGANTGQFGESLYDFGYAGRVISFEPVGQVHQQLIERSRRFPNWRVYPACAIGDREGSVDINVSDDTVFSSILSVKKSYTSSNPKSKVTETETVPLRTLDSLVAEMGLDAQTPTLLKIDTQGFEKQVLEGSQQLLNWIKGIKIEIPLQQIYENTGFTFYDTIDFMKGHGFYPYSFNIEGVNLKTGMVNTMDGLFFRDGN